MTLQEEIDIINSSIHKYVYSIEWLTSNEQVIDEMLVDVVNGSVNFDGTKSNRRSLNLTLKNLNKQYIPSPTSKMWINNKIRLKSGYVYGDNQTLVYNQGIYVLGNPSILSNPTQKEITIQGLDKMTLLDGTLAGKLKDRYQINFDTRIDESIKLLLAEVGETKYIIDECTELIPYDIIKECGVTVASIIEEIANIYSYEFFYDQEGYFRFRKALQPEDYNSTAVSWEYTTSGLYLDGTRDLDWNSVRNSIKVLGNTMPDGTVISALAQDNSSGDLSILAIGEKFELVEDNNIEDVSLAQIRANYELDKKIMFAETVKAKITPNFKHVVGDVISLVDENNGSEGNYVIQTIDYNIAYNSEMNLGLWKIKDWR